jgi:outer membrane autotransporter protein
VPLTPGRDLPVETLWNAWSETSFIGTSDRRYGLDLKNSAGSVSLGLDRRFTNDLVIGLTVAAQRSVAQGFDDNLRSESNGFSVGPYAALRLSEHWAVDASLTYGRTTSDIHIAILRGQNTPEIFSGALNLHGQFQYESFYLRPTASLYLTHVHTSPYELAGTVFGLPVTVRSPESDIDVGTFEMLGEVSRIFSLSGNAAIIPYVEIGTRYGFLRPSGGEIVTGDLKAAFPSAWSGSAKAGLRMSINSVLIEASARYLSLGQPDLDVWEGRLRLSVGF